MTQQITIAGKAFNVQPRYAEGHTLTANEASALNQTMFENLRNNFASRAKEGADQAAFDEYAAGYQFGVRTGGGGSRDPVETEAMNMARDAIKKSISAAGKKISDYSAKSISEAAVKLLAKDPSYRELAVKRVAEMQNAASETVDADLLASLEPAASAEPASTEGEGPVTDEEVASAGRRRK
jgi:hypothetical protein